MVVINVELFSVTRQGQDFPIRAPVLWVLWINCSLGHGESPCDIPNIALMSSRDNIRKTPEIEDAAISIVFHGNGYSSSAQLACRLL
jgi:hypothetical protein